MLKINTYYDDENAFYESYKITGGTRELADFVGFATNNIVNIGGENVDVVPWYPPVLYDNREYEIILKTDNGYTYYMSYTERY